MLTQRRPKLKRKQDFTDHDKAKSASSSPELVTVKIEVPLTTTSHSTRKVTSQSPEREFCPLNAVGKGWRYELDDLPVASFREHAATGCPKCTLLSAMSAKFSVDHFRPVLDWTNVLAKGEAMCRFDVFAARGKYSELTSSRIHLSYDKMTRLMLPKVVPSPSPRCLTGQ